MKRVGVTRCVLMAVCLTWGGMALARDPRAARQPTCEQDCEQDLKDCTKVCKEFAGEGFSQCSQACSESRKECLEECKSSPASRKE